jgi:uncharacterized protein (DUF433 family)
VKMQRLVVDELEVIQNILHYNEELRKFPKLAARIKQHPSWYAVKDSGKWSFGPSKFVGYANADAKAYLATYARKDGRETEPTLAKWFGLVNPATAIGKELQQAFTEFAGRYGKTPNANWRVSLLQDELVKPFAGLTNRGELDQRIAYDPDICGGRARIAGTRMRVSDIVALFAEGAERRTILEDFPYLTDGDLTAALAYASRSTDHLVLRAA